MKNIKLLALTIPFAIALNVGTAKAAIVDAGNLTTGSLFTRVFDIPSSDSDGKDYFDTITFSLLDTFDVRVFADNLPKSFTFTRIDLITGAPSFTWLAEDATAPFDFTETLGAGNYQVNFKYDIATQTRGTYTGGLSIAAVPEPETYAMLLAGLGLIGFSARRRKAHA